MPEINEKYIEYLVGRGLVGADIDLNKTLNDEAYRNDLFSKIQTKTNNIYGSIDQFNHDLYGSGDNEFTKNRYIVGGSQSALRAKNKERAFPGVGGTTPLTTDIKPVVAPSQGEESQMRGGINEFSSALEQKAKGLNQKDKADVKEFEGLANLELQSASQQFETIYPQSEDIFNKATKLQMDAVSKRKELEDLLTSPEATAKQEEISRLRKSIESNNNEYARITKSTEYLEKQDEIHKLTSEAKSVNESLLATKGKISEQFGNDWEDKIISVAPIISEFSELMIKSDLTNDVTEKKILESEANRFIEENKDAITYFNDVVGNPLYKEYQSQADIYNKTTSDFDQRIKQKTSELYTRFPQLNELTQKDRQLRSRYQQVQKAYNSTIGAKQEKYGKELAKLKKQFEEINPTLTAIYESPEYADLQRAKEYSDTAKKAIEIAAPSDYSKMLEKRQQTTDLENRLPTQESLQRINPVTNSVVGAVSNFLGSIAQGSIATTSTVLDATLDGLGADDLRTWVRNGSYEALSGIDASINYLDAATRPSNQRRVYAEKIKINDNLFAVVDGNNVQAFTDKEGYDVKGDEKSYKQAQKLLKEGAKPKGEIDISSAAWETLNQATMMASYLYGGIGMSSVFGKLGALSRSSNLTRLGLSMAGENAITSGIGMQVFSQSLARGILDNKDPLENVTNATIGAALEMTLGKALGNVESKVSKMYLNKGSIDNFLSLSTSRKILLNKGLSTKQKIKEIGSLMAKDLPNGVKEAFLENVEELGIDPLTQAGTSAIFGGDVSLPSFSESMNIVIPTTLMVAGGDAVGLGGKYRMLNKGAALASIYSQIPNKLDPSSITDFFNQGMGKLTEGLSEEDLKKLPNIDEISKETSGLFNKVEEYKQENNLIDEDFDALRLGTLFNLLAAKSRVESLADDATDIGEQEKYTGDLETIDAELTKLAKDIENAPPTSEGLTPKESAFNPDRIAIEKSKEKDTTVAEINATTEEDYTDAINKAIEKETDPFATLEDEVKTETITDKEPTQKTSDAEVITQQEAVKETPKIEAAVIEVDGKLYEGKNHAEAILKAQADGKDISQVNRQEQGKFRLSDGTIIDRAEAKKQFGQDRSELIIPQDDASKQANKDYAKVVKEQEQSKEEPIAEQQGKQKRVTEDIKQQKTKEDGIQKQESDESVFRTEQSKVGLQEMGKGDTKQEGVAKESKEKDLAKQLQLQDAVNSGVENMWKLTQDESFKANEDTDSGDGVITHEEMATAFLYRYKKGAEGLSIEGSSVVFRNKEGSPVGFAHFDKDGIREIGVDKSERGNGIASKMIDYLKLEKGIDKVLPPFSKEGNIVSHRNEVKKAIAYGKYQKAISNGDMTAQDAKNIIESAGLEVPKEIESILSKEQTPKEESNTKKVTPVKQGGKLIIDENGNLTDELPSQFEKLKNDKDLDGLNDLYSTVNIFLNGVAQSKGENTVKQFQKLKKELEDFRDNEQIGDSEISATELVTKIPINSKEQQPTVDSNSEVDALKDVESTAKALEGVDKEKGRSLFEFGKRIYDSIFNDLDTKENEIMAFLKLDEKQRDKQLQLEKGKLDKLQRQYDRKQLTTEADINALEKQKEKVELIDKLLESQKGAIADIDNQLSNYALEKYPSIFTKKGSYPFYIAKGYDNIKTNIISEAYHKAKEDGSNPELVKAVEDALKPTPEVSKPVSEVVEKGEGKSADVMPTNAWGSKESIDNNFYTKNENGFAVKIPLDRVENVNIDGIDFHVSKVDGDWKVIEKNSGLEVSTGKLSNTKKSAIEDATYRISNNGGANNISTISERAIKQFTDSNLKLIEAPISKTETTKEGSVGVGVDVGSKSILKSDVDLKGDKKKSWMRKNSLDKISVNDINEEGHNNNLSSAKENVKAGKKSQTKEAPLVEIDENGNATIIDGHHRIAEDILDGKSHIEAVVDNKFNIRDAIKDGLYEKAISEGRMTAKDAKEIIESAGLKVPKAVEESLKETPKTETTENPALKDVESTAKALEILPKDEDSNIKGIGMSPLDLDNEGFITWDRKDSQSVAEAYHKAKADGSNPELVKAVESLLSKEQAQAKKDISEQQVKEDETISLSQSESGNFITDGNTIVASKDNINEVNKIADKMLPKSGAMVFKNVLSKVLNIGSALGNPVIIHTGHDAMIKFLKDNGDRAVGKINAGVFGYFDGTNYHVVLSENMNLGKTQYDVLLHEFLHPYISSILANNPQHFDALVTELLSDEALKKKYFDEFANPYDNRKKLEEALIEYLKDVASSKINEKTIKAKGGFINAVKGFFKNLTGAKDIEPKVLYNTDMDLSSFANSLINAIVNLDTEYFKDLVNTKTQRELLKESDNLFNRLNDRLKAAVKNNRYLTFAAALRTGLINEEIPLDYDKIMEHPTWGNIFKLYNISPLVYENLLTIYNDDDVTKAVLEKVRANEVKKRDKVISDVTDVATDVKDSSEVEIEHKPIVLGDTAIKIIDKLPTELQDKLKQAYTTRYAEATPLNFKEFLFPLIEKLADLFNGGDGTNPLSFEKMTLPQINNLIEGFSGLHNSLDIDQQVYALNYALKVAIMELTLRLDEKMYKDDKEKDDISRLIEDYTIRLSRQTTIASYVLAGVKNDMLPNRYKHLSLVSDIYDALLQGFSDFKGAKKTMDDIVGAFKEAKRQMAEEVKNQYKNQNNKGKPKEQKPKEQKPPTDKKGKKDTPDRIKELADMIKAKKATESLSMTDYDKAEIELLHLLYTSTPLAAIEAAYNNLTSSTNGKAILDEYLKTIDNSIQEYYAGTTNATLRDTLSKNGIPLSIVGDVATLIESAHKDLKSLLREKVYQANAKKITKIVIDKAKQLITDKLKDISNYTIHKAINKVYNTNVFDDYKADLLKSLGYIKASNTTVLNNLKKKRVILLNKQNPQSNRTKAEINKLDEEIKLKESIIAKADDTIQRITDSKNLNEINSIVSSIANEVKDITETSNRENARIYKTATETIKNAGLTESDILTELEQDGFSEASILSILSAAMGQKVPSKKVMVSISKAIDEIKTSSSPAHQKTVIRKINHILNESKITYSQQLIKRFFNHMTNSLYNSVLGIKSGVTAFLSIVTNNTTYAIASALAKQWSKIKKDNRETIKIIDEALKDKSIYPPPELMDRFVYAPIQGLLYLAGVSKLMPNYVSFKPITDYSEALKPILSEYVSEESFGDEKSLGTS